ncbi:hypothetical protein EVA_08797 [gut metagenome]|uniref:Uncharacterized protein n=1 Tax=gut metagenome TaxID=749906 RepID=J9CSE0_9ZZZZ
MIIVIYKGKFAVQWLMKYFNNMADETTPKNKRDGLTARLKKKYPDRDWPDDEALFGQISDDYDEYDQAIGRYKEQEGKLTDLFAKDPRNAQFLVDMARGDDPWIAVIKRLGVDGVTELINDPEKQEAYAKANQDYVDRLAEEQTIKKEYDKNFSESLQTLEKVQQEQGLDDDTIDAAYELIGRISNDATLGKISEETVLMALKAVKHDADVETASREGLIAGKNYKAEENLRKPKKGDGTPYLQGSNNAPTQGQRKRRKNMFELANEAN